MISDFLTSTAGLIGAISIIMAAIFGFIRFLRQIYDKVSHVYSELTPNGGGSIKDSINRIEAMQVGGLQLTGKAFWISDPSGKCTFASVRLAAMMGISPGQMLGYGWVSAVSYEDREKCREEWDRAVRDTREFHMRYSYTHPDGQRVYVVGHAIPVVHSVTKQVVGMIGWAERDDQVGNIRKEESL